MNLGSDPVGCLRSNLVGLVGKEGSNKVFRTWALQCHPDKLGGDGVVFQEGLALYNNFVKRGYQFPPPLASSGPVAPTNPYQNFYSAWSPEERNIHENFMEWAEQDIIRRRSKRKAKDEKRRAKERAKKELEERDKRRERRRWKLDRWLKEEVDRRLKEVSEKAKERAKERLKKLKERPRPPSQTVIPPRLIHGGGGVRTHRVPLSLSLPQVVESLISLCRCGRSAQMGGSHAQVCFNAMVMVIFFHATCVIVPLSAPAALSLTRTVLRQYLSWGCV
jgi:hypothetical protein